MTIFVANRDERDHLLVEAARVALEANPTPRMIHFRVGHDGLPIEIPGLVDPQQSLPLEAQE
jgi:hypothetical protein